MQHMCKYQDVKFFVIRKDDLVKWFKQQPNFAKSKNTFDVKEKT